MDTEERRLYEVVGERIRHMREYSVPKISQAALARKLGVSRASVVNIEAGRQHAPLYLMWRIAEMLGTELAALIPNHDEFLESIEPMKLDAGAVEQIEAAAEGDPGTRRLLTRFISSKKSQIEANQ